MNKIKHIIILISSLFISFNSFAWGSKGHAIVSQIAFSYLDANMKKIVLEYLDGMTIEEAANWMDNIKNDHSYDYMKPQHYVNFEKGKNVENNTGANIISVLTITINELKNYKKLSKEEVKQKLCIIFHLIGDLHQPLHVGYGIDKGGNTMQINFNGNGTNLHSFFDSGIIKYKNITLNDCLNSNKKTTVQILEFQKGSISDWAAESRTYLDEIYNLDGHKITEDYVNSNSVVIQKQLYNAGLRLASILKDIFKN
jgi:hypothetical protein